MMTLLGCSGGSANDPSNRRAVALPGPAGAPPLAPASGAQRQLPGVDTSALVAREQHVFWKLVSELYAPCSDQAVSIAACVEEARPCAACKPAAKFLAHRVHQGSAEPEARAAYGLRFGPDVKKVEIGDSPSRGPADAKVTIVVWSDFECPHCRFAMPILEGIFKKYAPRIRLVHKFYPLRAHLNAEPAARTAIAAYNQGRYWEMEQILFANQSKQTQGDLDKYAASLTLDMNRYRKDLKADRTTSVLERDRVDADRLGLAGTPFILINGRPFDLDHFRLDGDLEAWIALELELTAGAALVAPPARTP
jgi:protein-disulfide isomerase